MGWDEYITKNLMAPLNSEGATLTSAAILGLDGSIWAHSDSFPEFQHNEWNKALSALDDTSTAVYIQGDKYIKTTADGIRLHARKDKVGFIMRKTNMTIVMGFYTEPDVDARVCSKVIEALGDYLENQGY
ncbi:hypothetical protein Vretimale_4145 [Volvox reticuliferus]|uniref:Profilin n=1 Tax=Volvox reticuliferus TaxID=1737510 RepID=A0A8J4DAC5_9CHLO|nr:hypothetical protein Vretifemale_2743 [Volvox reticuliferus]GIL98856.1 hypothetical protein Vretimale_4145 [Volvox reticuliferus]